MSAAEESINISTHDLQLVQNRVERCLQHYMHKREAIEALSMNDNIDPTVTDLIWQRLEEQNPEFFKAYYLKLLVKDQIMEFNRLLSKQVDLMRRTEPFPTCNGSSKTVSPLQQLTVHPSTSTVYSHSPNLGLARASNGNIHGADYGAISQFDLCCPPMVGDACMSSCVSASADMHRRHLNDDLLSGDCSSYGFLPQIPTNLSFSELTDADDFPNSSSVARLLGSYSRPHFMAPEANGFVDTNENMERLNPEGGNLIYQPFDGATD